MLGPRIAALRKNAGMSQAQLAKKLQISPSAVGMYEQGRREPSVDTLVALARVFGITTDFLLTGSPTSPEEAKTFSQMFANTLSLLDDHTAGRREQSFSRQELAVLMAAMLIEP